MHNTLINIINSGGIIFTFLLTTSIEGADYKTAPPEPQPNYWRATYGPEAGLSAAVHGGVGQLMGRPSEWGGGIAGFSKRAASGFGTHIIKNTIEFPVARMLHEDLHYHRSADTRFSPRLRHALISSVWTRKTTTGQGTLAVGRVSGAFGGGLISRLWQPASARTFASGISSGGISLGVHAGANVVREFWPHSGGSKEPPKPPE